jgi:agmatinase
MSAPRYSGVRTFARVPHSRALDGVDAAVVGVPFDTATSYRPGARFGPQAIRTGSTLLRPYHPPLHLNVLESIAVVDYGDLDTTPGNAERTAAQIADGLAPVLAAGAVPVVLGGDHSVVLGELRAHAAAAGGPLGVVLLDAHADTWDEYFGERYFHGTPFRRAVEEGLVAPERSLFAGMRGPLYAERDLDDARALGFELIAGDELRSIGPGEYSRRVRERVGDGPAFLSFDIDVIDPAFAPATGTPEVAGLLPHEALVLLRSLAGIAFRGYDVVEVAPPYDGPGETTAMLAANVAYELLALTAVARG